MTHYVELIWNKTIFLYFLLENIWSPVLRTLNGLWTEKCPTETHVGNILFLFNGVYEITAADNAHIIIADVIISNNFS